MNLDFCLVGFTKAGTTSLDAILRQDNRIILPQPKETHYFEWPVKKRNLKKFEEYYPKYRKNKLVGGIEPCHSMYANEFFYTFGKDVKILFMMRNPIEAEYSQFKMALKWGGDPKINYLFSKYYKRESIDKIFDRYVQNRLIYPEKEKYIGKYFRYEIWIKEWLKYYNLKNMKFIFFEDFTNNTEKIINEIYEFLELEPRILELGYVANQGNAISKNLFSIWFNYCFSIFKNRFEYRNHNNKILLDKIQASLFRYTLSENKKEMNRRTRELLRRYYMPTRCYLEELIKIDLKNRWF